MTPPAADFYSDDGVLETDAAGNLIFLNPVAREMLAFTDDGAGSLHAIFGDAEPLKTALADASSGGASPDFSGTTLLRADGVAIAVEGRVRAGPAGATIIFRETPVNTAILDDIIGDDPAAKEEVLAHFVMRARPVVATILAAGADSPECVRQEAHKLKSSARNIGAGPLAALCAKLESAARRGDTAALTALLPALPARFDAVVARIAPSARRASHGPVPRTVGDLRVAVVDDEPFIRDLVARILKGQGVARVYDYSGGGAFFDAKPEAHVVICDLNMPGMDGVSFLRRLATTGYAGAVILLSGEDERLLHAAEELAIAHRLRLIGTLQKPVRPATLSPLLALATRLSEKGAPGAPEPAPYTVAELEDAIASDALEVWFQPKISARTGMLDGAEALVRWRHPVYGMIPPSSFVALAEETGLMDGLTDLVLRKTLRHAGAWYAERPGVHFAVNLSVDTLSRPDLANRIPALAEAVGLPLAGLVLEITESRMMRDVRGALETLSHLRIRGVGLSIDDFGTGHSSLLQLRRIPFTEMKIDRMFVNGAATDTTARVILEAGAALGKKLGMSIVAEGVETRADFETAKAAGVDSIQGFLISAPVPPPEFASRFIAPAGPVFAV